MSVSAQALALVVVPRCRFLPKSVPSTHYKPTLSIQLEGAAQKKFGDHWGMMVGVRFENKGMETDARVKKLGMEAVNADGSGKIVGAWTGNVKTEVDLNYLTFPILATYSSSTTVGKLP